MIVRDGKEVSSPLCDDTSIRFVGIHSRVRRKYFKNRPPPLPLCQAVRRHHLATEPRRASAPFQKQQKRNRGGGQRRARAVQKQGDQRNDTTLGILLY